MPSFLLFVKNWLIVQLFKTETLPTRRRVMLFFTRHRAVTHQVFFHFDAPAVRSTSGGPHEHWSHVSGLTASRLWLVFLLLLPVFKYSPSQQKPCTLKNGCQHVTQHCEGHSCITEPHHQLTVHPSNPSVPAGSPEFDSLTLSAVV